jgi:hypothetical protein
VSTTAVTFRFPRLPSEYHFSEKMPKVGDVLERHGESWVVMEVAHAKNGTALVTLRQVNSEKRLTVD